MKALLVLEGQAGYWSHEYKQTNMFRQTEGKTTVHINECQSCLEELGVSSDNELSLILRSSGKEQRAQTEW